MVAFNRFIKSIVSGGMNYHAIAFVGPLADKRGRHIDNGGAVYEGVGIYRGLMACRKPVGNRP